MINDIIKIINIYSELTNLLMTDKFGCGYNTNDTQKCSSKLRL